jgi:hypothetical protein
MGAYRDDLDAAMRRTATLEAQLRAKEAEVAELRAALRRATPSPSASTTTRRAWPAAIAGLAAAALVAVAALRLTSPGPAPIQQPTPPAASAEAPAPTAPVGVVAADLAHGSLWAGAVGWFHQQQWTVTLMDRWEGADVLGGVDVLVVNHHPTRRFSPSEIESVVHFVSRGGGLLCGGQAWSWVHSQYGNKPVEAYPLNELGARIGFWVSERDVHAPAQGVGPLGAGVPLRHLSGWAPSELELRSPQSQVLVRDARFRVIAGAVEHERGRAAVLAHDAFANENPELLARLLRWLARK